MRSGGYSTAESNAILGREYEARLAAGDTQAEALAHCVRKFNLRSYQPVVSALAHLGLPYDELKASDWPVGYPVSELEHARLDGSAGLSADVSLPRPQTAAV